MAATVDSTVADLKSDLSTIIPPEAVVMGLSMGTGTYNVALDAGGDQATADSLFSWIKKNLDGAGRKYDSEMFRRESDGGKSYGIMEGKLTVRILNF